MSLINEALKKAQRQRSDSEAGFVTPMAGTATGATNVPRRPPPRRSNTLIFVTGALVLVVLTVVVSAILFNQPSDSAATIAVAKPTPAPTPVEAPTTAPQIVPPLFKPVNSAAVTASENIKSPAFVTAPAALAPSAPISVAVGEPAEPPRAAQASPAPFITPIILPSTALTEAVAHPSTRTAVAEPDPRVYAYVDSVRVTGIRPAGPDSRVLINERVFRVNDIVERLLGIRLLKVDTDSLTFTDPNGAIYVRYF